jgi:FdrA protein
MPTAQRMVHNLYRDSVALMQFSDKLAQLPAIEQASAVMATDNNLELLVEAGLLTDLIPASPNDLLIVIQSDDESALQAALDEAEKILAQKPSLSQDGERAAVQPRSIEMGLDVMPAANLALIATPGDYATAEALKALNLGLNVMLFSDSVSLDDEIMLKHTARDLNLLLMGPDCGTAIINGIPLGFANVVRRGSIGIVAASGTGLQQVTCLIHHQGAGISQAIGTGSHDLHEKVGGITMLQGIDALAADPNTQVLVLISKPPSPAVAAVLLEKAAQCGKPVVVDFVGADPAQITQSGIHAVRTLEDTAVVAVALAKGDPVPSLSGDLNADQLALVANLAAKLTPQQRFIRGLFSGGTFCFESVLLLEESLGGIYSNTSLKPAFNLADVWKSQGHTILDLGDDHFTKGRPHPMIDFRLRNERMIAEAADPETAIILLDVVLGYGSHEDPASELIPAIQKAQSVAQTAGRALIFVGFVCGTGADPQDLARQEESLRSAGVVLVGSNAQAARLCAAVVAGEKVK